MEKEIYENMTLEKLKAYCKLKNIRGYSRKTKQQIIDLIYNKMKDRVCNINENPNIKDKTQISNDERNIGDKMKILDHTNNEPNRKDKIEISDNTNNESNRKDKIEILDNTNNGPNRKDKIEISDNANNANNANNGSNRKDKIEILDNTNNGPNRKNKIGTKYNVLDLFCGCGGMTQGLKQTCNIICGIDIWDKAIESYKKNNEHLALNKDLTKFAPEELEKLINKKVDIIVGGPPCQGFSMAGKRDKNDPRNSLFMEFYKYLNYFKPKAFIMENVLGILSMKTTQNENVIDIIMEKLNENYNCHINKLYTSDFYVPQNRRRVIIIGINKNLDFIPTEIKPLINSITDRIPVSSILLQRNNIDKKYYLSQKAINGINTKIEKMKEKNYGFKAQFLHLDKPSYTIPARYWKDGYDALVKYDDQNIRRLTILELKRIQTFPDNYILIGSNKEQIMQIGNAVPCTFAYYLGIYITNLLNSLNYY